MSCSVAVLLDCEAPSDVALGTMERKAAGGGRIVGVKLTAAVLTGFCVVVPCFLVVTQ